MTTLPKLLFTIFAFSFLLIFVQSSKSQCEPDNRLRLDDFELKNSVKEVVTYKISFEKEKQSGLLVKGKPEIEDEMFFDAQGNSNIRRGSETNKVKVKREYQRKSICDSSNRILLIKYMFEDGTSLDAEIYKYDERNNLVEEKAFRGEDSLYSTDIYQYNSGNKLIKHSYFDKENNLKDQYFYKYEGENVVEKIHYQNPCVGKACDGQINSGDGLFLYATKENYKYDSKGNWIEKIESQKGLDGNSNDYILEAIYTRKISYFKD